MRAEPGGQKLTLEEIGQRAGVSRSTVSRVLNGHPDVRGAVRERVEAVIAATGFQPNAAARALVSRRSGLIGLVMLTGVDELFGDPYYSALVNGISQGCVEHELIFAIFPTFGTDESTDALTPQIARRFVDGVIITSEPTSAALIDHLRRLAEPLVVIGPTADDHGLTRVDVDNQGGAAMAVAHLVALGRRRIGCVAPTVEFRYGADRIAGYRHGIGGAAGFVELVELDAPTVAGAQRATARLLAARPDLDAVFAATDTMAEGVYRALAEHGRRIPDDVAVVGFDGMPGAAALDPVLTTVVQPVADLGRNAVRLLAAERDVHAEPELVVLGTELRVGGSCGAALSRS